LYDLASGLGKPRLAPHVDDVSLVTMWYSFAGRHLLYFPQCLHVFTEKEVGESGIGVPM
jgi:hypothetical protein